jgi:predicted molibdopterin-dependent oxidoreductase YjgC
MTSQRVAAERDLVEPGPDRPLTILVDGEPVTGTAGQTIAGVLLGAGRRQWRTTREGGAPRGVFCGIGVCFDCLVEVNGVQDVRACLRRAQDGDVVTRQGGRPVEDEEATA